jgi:hypothetical protein
VTRRATPAPGGTPASRRTAAGVARALRAGVVAWLPIALAGQLLAWTAYAVTGAYRPWSWIKVGLLHTVLVARTPVDVRTAPPSSLRELFPQLFGPPTVRVSVALGAGTIVAVVLLFRAGREAAAPAAARPGVAAAVGALVAPGFAVPCAIAGLVVTLGFPQAAVTSVRPVAWLAFVLPLALGAAAGAAGGLAAARAALASTAAGRRCSAAARGAWHALAWAVALAFVGVLVVATVRPSATAAYGRWLEARGSGGAIVAMYHAVLMPNAAVDVAAIGMGACAELDAGGARSRLCLGGLDAGEGVALLATGGARRVDLGPGYALFVLVPALATVAGGRRAAEGARHRAERALRAVAAGVGFAALFAVAAWAASVEIVAEADTVARLGVPTWRALGVALAWGVGGGLLGSLLPDRAGVGDEPALGRQPPEASPTETSVK